MYSLVVVQGNASVSQFDIPSDTVTRIGRDSTNDIVLDDKTVSRFHAEIHRNGEIAVILDLRSSNGLFVNNHRVVRHLLCHDDHLRLGQTVMQFRMPDVETPQTSSCVSSPEDKTPFLESNGKKLFGSDLRPLDLKNESTARPVPFPEAETNPMAMRRYMHLFEKIARVLLCEPTRERIVNRVLQLIFEYLPVDYGAIMLFEPENGDLVPKAGMMRFGVEDESFEISTAVAAEVLRHGKSIFCHDLPNDPRWS